MKKIITKLLLILTIFSVFGFNIVGNINAASGIVVEVTEFIPGAGCTPDPAPLGYDGIYTCTVEPGFGSVVSMIGEIIENLTFLVALGGVLFIVYNGIMYSMGGMEQSLKDDAKKRIIQTLIGLIILYLSGPILNLIAPWVYVK